VDDINGNFFYLQFYLEFTLVSPRLFFLFTFDDFNGIFVFFARHRNCILYCKNLCTLLEISLVLLKIFSYLFIISWSVYLLFRFILPSGNCICLYRVELSREKYCWDAWLFGLGEFLFMQGRGKVDCFVCWLFFEKLFIDTSDGFSSMSSSLFSTFLATMLYSSLLQGPHGHSIYLRLSSLRARSSLHLLVCYPRCRFWYCPSTLLSLQSGQSSLLLGVN
jgi:hypothetical protein